MRFSSSVTSLSWIPSEAVTGPYQVPFTLGVAHYDQAPPAQIDDIERHVRNNDLRFANILRAWIDVTKGFIVGYGMEGDGVVAATALSFSKRTTTFAAVAYPTLRKDPEVNNHSVTFVQTCGGRTGVPCPRPVKRYPFFQIAAPVAWTTLELTISIDGTASGKLIGASPFPRHWVYDASGAVCQKSALMDFARWTDEHFGRNTPWGDADTPAHVLAVESALERQLSVAIMREGQKPILRRLVPGELLCEQGAHGQDLFLILDGVLEVLVGGEKIVEVGPGAVVGERAILEGGARSATLRALTRCRIAVAPAEKIDRERLLELSHGHRREEQR